VRRLAGSGVRLYGKRGYGGGVQGGGGVID
jgi:hypothetical protein